MKSVLLLDGKSMSEMRQNALRRIQQHFDVAEGNRQFLELCEI